MGESETLHDVYRYDFREDWYNDFENESEAEYYQYNNEFENRFYDTYFDSDYCGPKIDVIWYPSGVTKNRLYLASFYLAKSGLSAGRVTLKNCGCEVVLEVDPTKGNCVSGSASASTKPTAHETTRTRPLDDSASGDDLLDRYGTVTYRGSVKLISVTIDIACCVCHVVKSKLERVKKHFKKRMMIRPLFQSEKSLLQELKDAASNPHKKNI